jgi:hypothetical protein
MPERLDEASGVAGFVPTNVISFKLGNYLSYAICRGGTRQEKKGGVPCFPVSVARDAV